MAESAVNFLIEYVGPLLLDEVKLLKGVRGEVRKIRDELESMRAFLRDADAKEHHNESIKAWVRQVRYAAYDTEDILDEFIVHIGQYQEQDSRGVFASLRKMAHSIKQLKARRRIGKQIGDMRCHLSEISKRKDDYKLNRTEEISVATNLNRGAYDPRMAALFAKESELVGIDAPKALLIDWLLRGEPRLSTMSVVGMGGLGKTTLAKKVFDSQQVKQHFETYAWIAVSETYDRTNLLRDMVKKLHQAKQVPIPPEVEAITTDIDLIQALRDYLENKRFLLVFDDVWAIDVWKFLTLAMPSEEKNSRAILTTRRHDVARSCCVGPCDCIYELPALDPNTAWYLFCGRAFPAANDQNNPCPRELFHLAQNFVNKCGGLPLAIITLGGLLASKGQSSAAWELTYRTLGSALEGDHIGSTTEILWLSFNDLPYYIKSCFLYLSLFPEDYYFAKELIISQWIAEGFIMRNPGMTLEEIGESYLKDLVDRSLVQAMETDGYEHTVRFRIHDLLREIIIFKSKEEHLSLVSYSGDKDINIPDRIRRLSISSKCAILPKCKSSSNLRSLFVFGTPEPNISSVIPSFPGMHLLRVVHLFNVGMDSFPEHLTSLLHLRHLYLAKNRISRLPGSIGKLIKLESLILEETYVHELPLEISKLRCLRHLRVERILNLTSVPPTFVTAFGAKVHSGVGNLTSLQELSYVGLEAGTAGELRELTQLRSLGIFDLRREDGDDLCSAIEKMSHLQFLHVRSKEEGEEIDMYSSTFRPPTTLQELYLAGRLTKLPQWITTLQNLHVLRLGWSRLKDDPLKALGSLPNLQQLRLIHAYGGDELCAKKGEYKKLTELTLSGLPGLTKVEMEKGAMPNLEVLSLGECGALVEKPCWLQHLTSLQTLFLHDMTMDFLNSLQSGAERADFIRHIPHVSHENIQTGSYQLF